MKGMPPVSKCDVSQCFYNKDKACRAPAINVGRDHPACDTFITNGGHGGFNGTGSVGACHVDHCRFNQGLLCTAQAVSVGQHAGHADCATYERR